MEKVIDKVSASLVDLIIQPIIYLLVGLSFFYFFWGLTIFLINADDKEKRIEGKSHMIWGGVGLLIITSVWGILNLLNSTIGQIFS